MKRAVTSIMTLVFLGFLLIGAIGVFQNIIHDVEKSFSHEAVKHHILAYRHL